MCRFARLRAGRCLQYLPGEGTGAERGWKGSDADHSHGCERGRACTMPEGRSAEPVPLPRPPRPPFRRRNSPAAQSDPAAVGPRGRCPGPLAPARVQRRRRRSAAAAVVGGLVLEDLAKKRTRRMAGKDAGSDGTGRTGCGAERSLGRHFSSVRRPLVHQDDDREINDTTGKRKAATAAGVIPAENSPR